MVIWLGPVCIGLYLNSCTDTVPSCSIFQEHVMHQCLCDDSGLWYLFCDGAFHSIAVPAPPIGFVFQLVNSNSLLPHTVKRGVVSQPFAYQMEHRRTTFSLSGAYPIQHWPKGPCDSPRAKMAQRLCSRLSEKYQLALLSQVSSGPEQDLRLG